ncbi:MAG: hypothetical protein DWQ36_00980 [Acidobacteria bacterium]|nr:MAG: hypothetical protein DWQ36_00980 [Acidobacteriota bacterium]
MPELRSAGRSTLNRRRVATALPSVLLLLALLVGVSGAAAQQEPQLPDGVTMRHVDLWSDGTRISGTLFSPPGHTADSALPGIVVSHGWGGTRGHLNQAYAPFFAAAGFVTLTIDYRGWGDSDSRLVLEQEQPEIGEDGTIDLAGVKVKALREIVDPLDQTEDIRNAITWLQGEPGVDPERIGLWGTSYSGGHVIYVAAHDPRVKVTVSQVGSQDSVGIFTEAGTLGGLDGARKLAIQRARGDAKPYADTAPAPGLSGTPAYTRMMSYSPREVAHRSNAASLFIDAENEELFDIREHGRAVYALLKNRVPAKYVLIEDIAHYDIYRGARQQAVDLAIAWYEEHL